MIFKWRTTLGATCASLSLAGFAHAAMHTPGKFDVSELGAATYSIPILVPPPTAGMGPKLAFSFNSQSVSGNSQSLSGTLGKGWSIAGMSNITRCGQTIAQDGGLRSGVNFDGNDRFCLDGQRLVVSNGGMYGANGTEYRTERDNFSRIISYGIAGTGPAWFKVWSKSGETMEYGNTTDSRIEAQGKPTVRIWALNRVQDSVSNYMTVSYIKETESGDFYPNALNYTGNSNVGMMPNNSVRFKYEKRPDIATMYQAGSSITTSMRLTNVETYTGAAKVMDFRLAYMGSSDPFRSRLSSITQCDGAGAICLPATKFDWESSANELLSVGAWLKTGAVLDTGAPILHSGNSFLVGDVNGDGKTDLLRLMQRESTLWILPLISNGNEFVAGTWQDTGVYGNATVSGDFNGDGKIDVAIIGDGYILPMYSNGTSFDKGVPYQNSVLNGYNSWVAMDINGDGKADLVQYKTSGNELWLLPVISTGNSFNPGVFSLASSRQSAGWAHDAAISIFPIELNGDGKMDFIEMWRNNLTGNIWLLPLFSNGSGFSAGSWFDTGLPGYDTVDPGKTLLNQYIATDLNGDGIGDFVIVNKPYTKASPMRRNVYYSTFYFNGVSFVAGEGRSANATWNYPSSLYAESTIATDLNGDGRMDLIQVWLSNNTGGGVQGEMWLQPIVSSEGKGLISMAPYNTHLKGNTVGAPYAENENGYSFEGKGPGLMALDINGDGKLDLVQQTYKNYDVPITIQAHMIDGGIGDLMTSITGGTGAKIDVVYKTLADNDVYTPDMQSLYPVADVTMPLYVVSTVNRSNGKRGVNSSSYTYGGLKLDWSRGGIIGFRWRQEKQIESGLTKRSEYRQDWPYIGMIANSKTMLAGRGNGDRLNDVSSSYACIDPIYGGACTIAPGRVYFPYAAQSVDFSWDLNGAIFPANTTTTNYDSWGNAKKVVKTSIDGVNAFSNITENVYNSADLINWHLAQLQRSTTTNTRHAASTPPFPLGPIGAWPGGEGSVGPGINNPGNAGITTSTTFLTAGYPSPEIAVPGQVVELKVYVKGAVVRTGYVTFSDENEILAMVALDASGSASFSASLNRLGEHTITATYSGDARNSSSSIKTVIRIRQLDLSPIIMLLMD
ncbi:FG-GAP-like repeat-containing protein [Janthinobacterium aestuarii]